MVKINYNSTVSLTIDAQKGFTPLCPEELPVTEGDEIVTEMLRNNELAQYKYMSKDAHSRKANWVASEIKPQFTPVVPISPNLDIHWNSHCNVGEEGFELLDGLPHTSEYDYIVYKGVEKDMHPYSPIYHDLAKKISTGIIEKARHDQVKTFLLGGLALDYCLGEGAFDLLEAGFEVIVNLGATRAIGNQDEYVLKLRDVGIKVIKSTAEILLK
jgi:nicotinamidase/pyrazinamidase